jgi:hypothetical protein
LWNHLLNTFEGSRFQRLVYEFNNENEHSQPRQMSVGSSIYRMRNRRHCILISCFFRKANGQISNILFAQDFLLIDSGSLIHGANPIARQIAGRLAKVDQAMS